jgi:beta-glucosidase/6-phospho-beta-glucosidase/beta-galactosidase
MKALLPVRSALPTLTQPDSFWWATGIEDTFITAPHAVTGRTLDEYELTGHYERWGEDLGLMASLGISAARYGVPWHRIQPEKGRWDWRHADEPLERLLEYGISPQVDLVHYGLPGWIDGAYLNAGYPDLVAEYAARLAERFRGRIHWYTPLNEPRITAWYCGRLGWWPPYQRSWRGFARIILNIACGIQKTVAALREVDKEIVVYHVDATDLYETEDPSLEGEAERRRNIVYLALDLVSGRVAEGHPLFSWFSSLVDHGALEAMRDHPAPPEVIGLNLYPLFTRKRLERGKNQKLRIRMPYTEHGLIENVARAYHHHFGVPLMISEVATSGPVRKRLAWLRRSLESVKSLRSAGVPVVGYTWWPMFALVTWAWRQGHRSLADHLLQMGLWDLDEQLNRIPTALVDAYRQEVLGGTVAVGRLAST